MSDDTTIVYAVNDFAAIAKALRELNGPPQHHGTALAVIEAPTPRRGVRELLEEQREAMRSYVPAKPRWVIEAELYQQQRFNQAQAHSHAQHVLADPGHAHHQHNCITV